MKAFAYSRAGDAPTALALISHPRTKFLAGGTNLVDLMRENIEQPDTVVDITGLPFTQLEELPSGGLSIGATARNHGDSGRDADQREMSGSRWVVSRTNRGGHSKRNGCSWMLQRPRLRPQQFQNRACETDAGQRPERPDRPARYVMSVIRKVVETAARYMPDRAADPLMHAEGHIGRPYGRVDGPLKVTGRARFAAEFAVEGLTHAALVCSTIAKGRATTIDTAATEAAPGVIGVMTHANAPRMKPPSLMNVDRPKAFSPSNLPILQDNRVCWNGQPLAVVVAETLEQAEYGASLVRVAYEPDTAQVSFDDLKASAASPQDILGEPAELTIGDAAARFAAADVTVDDVYRTPWYHHNAIEPHATTAAWDDDGTLMVFESTQTVSGNEYSLAEVFALKPEAVQVIALFVGGGFGGKAGLWQNTVLCVAAAKVTGRAVRLALTREHVFRMIGGRTIAEQRVALGARANGHLAALIHTGTTATATHARYAEQCTFPPRHLYASDSIHVGQKVVNLDTVANTWMRAPGESIGTFALESALDELAYRLNIDPIELRRINEPAKDPTKGIEFSNRNLIEACRRGAAQFGWSRRNPEPCSQRDGRWLIGQGVATAYYPVYRFPATARVRLSADGTAVVKAAANEWEWARQPCRFSTPPSAWGCQSTRCRFSTAIRRCPTRRWRVDRARR
jgi:xanthine dehydrogenase YagR molybdenum-binding subunit